MQLFHQRIPCNILMHIFHLLDFWLRIEFWMVCVLVAEELDFGFDDVFGAALFALALIFVS